MGQSIRNHIQTLIEQTSDVFETAGSMNTDYADFATLALQDFRLILKMPNLTDRQLKQMIRRARMHHRFGQEKGSWHSFTAKYMSQKANENQIPVSA